MSKERPSIETRIQRYPKLKENIHEIIDIYEKGIEQFENIEDLEEIMDQIITLVSGMVDGVKKQSDDSYGSLMDGFDADEIKKMLGMSEGNDISKIDFSKFDFKKLFGSLNLSEIKLEEFQKGLKKEFNAIYEDGFLEDISLGIDELLGIEKPTKPKKKSKKKKEK